METTARVLSKDDVQKTLESIFEDEKIKNPDIKIEAGSVKGDGYMSFLTKVDVTSDDKDLHLMIKVAPKVEAIRKMIPIRDVYLREMFFYDTIMKEFQELEKQQGVSETVNVPKCYKTIKEDGNEMLVMDNIKLKGYRMWNRKVQMNEEHVNMVFKEYAKLHATSYAMKDQNPDLFKNLSKNLAPIFTSETMSPDMYDKFINNSKTSCANIFNPETDKDICDSIQKYLDGLQEFYIFIEKNKSEHSVIIHGDSWCNNMMFKYENEEDPLKLTEMCFLDFQICVLGSPALDLCYFFHVSSSKDILYNYKHHLILYYEELKKHYLQLGGNTKNLISFEDLLSEWKLYAKFGFTMALFIFKIMLCDDEEAMDFNDVSEQNLQMMDIFARKMNNDKITEQMVKILAMYMFDNDFF